MAYWLKKTIFPKEITFCHLKPELGLCSPLHQAGDGIPITQECEVSLCLLSALQTKICSNYSREKREVKELPFNISISAWNNVLEIRGLKNIFLRDISTPSICLIVTSLALTKEPFVCHKIHHGWPSAKYSKLLNKFS